MSEKLLLIDGHSILNRAFYGMPDLTNSQGQHTGAVFGFLNILFKILEEEQPQYLAVAFDTHAPTFRHKQYAAYKGTRKGMPEELRSQVPLMQEMLRAMDIPVITQEGIEADDILGTLAKRAQKDGIDAVILSGDRDLLQLADEKILIRIPKTSKGKTEIFNYRPEDVKEAYGVTPLEFIDVKALQGDTSDNIPGVPKIGEKTATAIIQTYGSIENAYAHADEVKPPMASRNLKEYWDQAVMSKDLATIRIDCEVAVSYSDAKLTDYRTPEAYAMIKQLGFQKLLARFEQTEIQSGETEHFQWRTVRTEQEADEFFASVTEDGVIGIQLTGKKEDWKRTLLCAAVSTEKETVCFIPGESLSTEALTPALMKLSFSGRKVWFPDLKEALHILYPCWKDAGFPYPGLSYADGDLPNTLMDLHLAAYLLNPLKSEQSYDEIAANYGGMTLQGPADIGGKKAPAEYNPEQLEVYTASAACAARVCAPALEQALKEQEMYSLYETVDLPLIYSMMIMEYNGIRVEKESLQNYGKSLESGISELQKTIYEETGTEFNILSPKQLGEVLFEKMQLPGGKKTKTGYSTSADVLEKLAPDYPVINRILEYRQLTKLKSTYADGLAAFISEDGRIHGTFHETVTATGRLSSSDPNLQNIPVRMELGRAIRKVFVPEDGHVFVDADYSQIELRILASMSGDEKLIEAYREARDIHAVTASQVFHVPLEEVTPELRRNAKAVNFGIVYGISAFGLSDNLSITQKEAKEYIKAYFETYPKVKAFLDGLVKSAKEAGYSLTEFGRRRPVPELRSSNFMQRSFGERVAMNAPIQGTAADIMKIAMIRVENRLRKEKRQARLTLQVHDELLIETPESEIDAVKQILVEEMGRAADLKVPLEVSVSVGKTWYETK